MHMNELKNMSMQQILISVNFNILLPLYYHIKIWCTQEKKQMGDVMLFSLEAISLEKRGAIQYFQMYFREWKV